MLPTLKTEMHIKRTPSVFFIGYLMEALPHKALHQENVIYLYFSRFATSISCCLCHSCKHLGK